MPIPLTRNHSVEAISIKAGEGRLSVATLTFSRCTGS